MTKSVLIADGQAGLRERLAAEFSVFQFDVWVANDIESVEGVLKLQRPHLVVTELKFVDGTWRDVLCGARTAGALATVILTNSGSIASAVAATRAGVTNYLTKPVTAVEILRLLQVEASVTAPTVDNGASPLSLDRMIWELLCQAVETWGSISAAARILRIDRRSLRRMLQKNPPAR